MVKESTSEASAGADAPVQEVTLTEFCMRQSQTDRRVEMIGAFEFDETRSGRQKDFESAYAARYQAFCNKPA